jgi:hypothetical protein
VGRAEGLDIASRTLLLRGLAAMAEVPLAAPTKARSAVVVDFAPEEERQQLDSHQQAAREAVANAAGALFPSLQLLWAAVPPPLPQGAPADNGRKHGSATNTAGRDAGRQGRRVRTPRRCGCRDRVGSLGHAGGPLGGGRRAEPAAQPARGAATVDGGARGAAVVTGMPSGRQRQRASRVEVTMDGLLAVGGVASADVLDGADALQAATAEIEASLGANTLAPRRTTQQNGPGARGLRPCE